MPPDKLGQNGKCRKVFSDTTDNTALECIAEWEGLQQARMTNKPGERGLYRQCKLDRFGLVRFPTFMSVGEPDYISTTVSATLQQLNSRIYPDVNAGQIS